MPSDLRTGNIPDHFDARDFPLYTTEEFQSALSSQVPPTAEDDGKFVLKDLPPVYDQWNIGSCTANAVAAALRYAHKKNSGKAYADFEPSRLFIYYNARVSDFPEDMNAPATIDVQARAHKDSGCKSRTAIHSLLMQGVCTEALWPYGKPSSKDNVFDDLDKKPNPVEPLDLDKAMWQARGSSHPKDGKDLSGQADTIPRAISYYRIFDPSVLAKSSTDPLAPPPGWNFYLDAIPIALLEQTLRDGYPFVFSFSIFEDADITKDAHVQKGVLVMPPWDKGTPPERHTVMAIGFDSKKEMFLVQNSWGTNWPKDNKDQDMMGRFWMPYAWHRKLGDNYPATSDYWVIKTGAR